MIVICGPNGCGKSSLAERLAFARRHHPASQPGALIYLATMTPATSDGRRRVATHRRTRSGKGFLTIESPLADLERSHPGFVEAGDVVLLEDASNLLANLMFAAGVPDPVAEAMACITALDRSCQQLIIVSIAGLEPQADQDQATWDYIDQLNQLNQALTTQADWLIRVGQPC